MTLQIDLDDLEANTGTADDDGNEWWMVEPPGWGFPPVRVGVQNRPFADGAWVEPGFTGAWDVTLRGSAVAQDYSGLQRARYRLARTVNLLRRTGLLVVHEDEPKQMTVRLLDRPDMAEQGLSLAFQIPLVAADPHKYGTTEHAASTGLTGGPGSGVEFPLVFPITFGAGGVTGVLSMPNAGDADSPPTFTINGPVVDPTIQHLESGATMAFDLTVADGETLVVDMKARTVLAGGTASRRYAVVPGSFWFVLQPGSNTVRYSADAYDPDSTIDALWRDAW